jgi:LuxR family transcriptional regulator, activator of conjugal transfer of Ti plasmids
MLRFVNLAASEFVKPVLTPALLEPLVDAARNGRELVPVVEKLVKKLGFDSFLCGLSTSARPDREAQLYAFTTLPREWARLYDEKAYIEVDPRVQLTYDQATMMVWSGDDFRGRNARLDAFLDDAARFGVRSGACFTTHDAQAQGVMVAFNSTKPRLSEIERATVAAEVGNLYAFGTYFHEVFMRAVVERGLPSRLRGAALTKREIQVLKMVSRGLTAEDIGIKLDITPRTVRFHVDAARTKMGAANREEAIALAVKGGLFGVLP